jgi:hypothetical protein
MAKYNILASSLLTTPEGYNEGNTNLNYNQLKTLYDGNISQSLVSLSVSDILYLDIAINYRLRVDSFGLYLSPEIDVLDHIDFYYKNISTEEYTLLTKAYNGIFYYASSLPDYFSPGYLRVTVSGVSGFLNEVFIYNDDSLVGFGLDGSQTQIDLRDSESPNTPNSVVLEIKNTSEASMVHAFACVDYTGKEEDFYIKVSNDNTNFLGLNDGHVIDNDYEYSNYKFKYGTFDNTIIIDRDKLVLDTTFSGAIGTYTTPIIAMEVIPDCGCLSNISNFSRYDSSFIITKQTAVSGTGFFVEATDIGYTMEVRSSNEDPKDYIKIFNYDAREYYHTDGYLTIYIRDAFTGNNDIFRPEFHFSSANVAYSKIVVRDTVVDYITGDIYVIFGNQHTKHSSTYNRELIYKFSYDSNLLVAVTTIISSAPNIQYDMKGQISSTGYLWWFEGKYYGKIRIYDTNIVLRYTLTDISNVSVSLVAGDTTAWVITNSSMGVYRINMDGTLLHNIPEPSAKKVAFNYDGGCWIYENATQLINKYEPYTLETGELSFKKTIVFGPVTVYGEDCSDMVNDMTGKDGLWFCYSNNVVRINADGKISCTAVLSFKPTDLKDSSLGVLARSYNYGYYAFIDFSGNILYSGKDSASYRTGVKALTYKNAVAINNTDLLPQDDDPVWGISGSLEWKKTSISGYFLPKTKYHQVRYTLRTTVNGATPEISSITIPKPVVITDIPKDSTKPLYIRTNFSGNEEYKDYNTKLKVWWYLPE